MAKTRIIVKRLLIPLLIIVLLFSSSVYDIAIIKSYANNEQSGENLQGLNINYFPLGTDTGETYESYIISYNDIQILVDAGASYNANSPNASNIIVSKLQEIMGEDKTLDYVIATHADSDHIAGFSTKGGNGVFDYCLKDGISVSTLIDFDLTQDDTINFNYKDDYYLTNTNTGNETVYGRYVSARSKLIKKGTVYYTASQCCWECRGIDKPNNAPNSNIFVLDSSVLTLEILYNYYYDHRFNYDNKISSMDRNVLSVCFMLTYKTDNKIKTFLFTGDLEEFDSRSGTIPTTYNEADVDENDDYDEDIDIDELEGQDYSVAVYGESKLWDYLISEHRKQILLSNQNYIYYDIKNGVTFYKAGHHGSRTSNSKNFIDNIRPNYVVIPCVAGSNQYTSIVDDQFPAKVVLSRLFKYTDYIYIPELAVEVEEGITKNSIPYYGDIIINCNNGTIDVKTSQNQGVFIQNTDWFNKNRFAPLNVFTFSTVVSEDNAYIGNCTLVKYGHTDILIDCGVYGTIGNNAIFSTCFIDKLNKYIVDGIIEYVVISSAQSTSLQQLVDLTSNSQEIKGVLSYYKINNIIDYGIINDPTEGAPKSLYKSYNAKKQELLNTNDGIGYYSSFNYCGKTISICDNLSISILDNKNYQKDKNYDVCFTINHLGKKLLFTGNITNDAEENLVKNNDLSNIVYYRASFFGYDDSNSQKLLNAIKNDRLYIVINSVANKNISGYKTLSKATCDRIINTSSKHFSYLTSEYKNGKYYDVCGDITFSLYAKNNEIKYSLKSSKSTQRLCDTEYYEELKR